MSDDDKPRSGAEDNVRPPIPEYDRFGFQKGFESPVGHSPKATSSAWDFRTDTDKRAK